MQNMETHLLNSAGPYHLGFVTPQLGETVERIELRPDGRGISGYYDMIYIYVEGRDEARCAMPAHATDHWEYV